jgi:hypothetical protein
MYLGICQNAWHFLKGKKLYIVKCHFLITVLPMEVAMFKGSCLGTILLFNLQEHCCYTRLMKLEGAELCVVGCYQLHAQATNDNETRILNSLIQYCLSNPFLVLDRVFNFKKLNELT